MVSPRVWMILSPPSLASPLWRNTSSTMADKFWLCRRLDVTGVGSPIVRAPAARSIPPCHIRFRAPKLRRSDPSFALD
jgi:hypothetical protein